MVGRRTVLDMAVSGRTCVLVGFAGFGLFWGAWGAVLPLVARHAGVDEAGLGIALVWIGLGALTTLRVVGALADRHLRATLVLSVGMLALSTVGPGVARGTVGLSVACAVVGVCSGAVDAAVNAAGARYEGTGQSVLNLAHGLFSSLVVVASLAVAGLLVGSASSPWPLVLVGATLLVCAFGLAALPMPRHGGGADLTVDRRARTRSLSKPLLVLGTLGATAYLIENAWQSWSSIQLNLTLRASPAVAAIGPAVFATCPAAGRFAGHAAQRRWYPRTLLAMGASLAALGSALAAFAPSIATALLGIALAGLGTSVCAPTLITAAGRLAPQTPGAATSTVITLSYLGFVFGPAAVGLLASATTLRIALAAVAAAAALLALASRAVPSR